MRRQVRWVDKDKGRLHVNYGMDRMDRKMSSEISLHTDRGVSSIEIEKLGFHLITLYRLAISSLYEESAWWKDVVDVEGNRKEFSAHGFSIGLYTKCVRNKGFIKKFLHSPYIRGNTSIINISVDTSNKENGEELDVIYKKIIYGEVIETIKKLQEKFGGELWGDKKKIVDGIDKITELYRNWLMKNSEYTETEIKKLFRLKGWKIRYNY